jgi:hypothetical protein
LSDTQTCALLWAGDANKFVCAYALKDDVEGVQGVDLSGDYYEGAVPVIDEMIFKAGRRLGAWLNALAAQEAKGKGDGGNPGFTDQSASLPSVPAMEL